MAADEPNQFEDDLERRLAANNRRSWVALGWANKPFSIFILSTCLVGLIGYCFTNFTTCHASFVNDTERFNRLWQELSYRAAQVTVKDRELSVEVWRNFNHYNRASVMSSWRQALDPSANYLYNENKGRFPYEVLADAQAILRSWYPHANPLSPQSGSVYLLSGVFNSGMMAWRALYVQSASKVPKKEEADNWVDLFQDWADGLSVAFYRMRSAWQSPLPESACKRRTFFPFVPTGWFSDEDASLHPAGLPEATKIQSSPEAPRIYIERVEIIGNAELPDAVIRNRIQLSEGDRFDQKKVDKSLLFMNAVLGLTSARATISPGSKPDLAILRFQLDDLSDIEKQRSQMRELFPTE